MHIRRHFNLNLSSFWFVHFAKCHSGHSEGRKVELSTADDDDDNDDNEEAFNEIKRGVSAALPG